MTQPLAIPTFREQDFQAPQSRTVGAGVEGLEEITDWSVPNACDACERARSVPFTPGSW